MQISRIQTLAIQPPLVWNPPTLIVANIMIHRSLPWSIPGMIATVTSYKPAPKQNLTK